MKVQKKKKDLKEQEKLTNLALPPEGISKRRDDNELPTEKSRKRWKVNH